MSTPLVWETGVLNGYSSTRRLAMGFANVRAGHSSALLSTLLYGDSGTKRVPGVRTSSGKTKVPLSALLHGDRGY